MSTNTTRPATRSPTRSTRGRSWPRTGSSRSSSRRITRRGCVTITTSRPGRFHGDVSVPGLPAGAAVLSGRTPMPMLYAHREVAYASTGHHLNPPTSWYWNIRIGDKVQINGAGQYYTVVGPMSYASHSTPSCSSTSGRPARPAAHALHSRQRASTPSFSSWSTARTTTRTGSWTTAGTASTTTATATSTRPVTSRVPASTTSSEWIEREHGSGPRSRTRRRRPRLSLHHRPPPFALARLAGDDASLGRGGRSHGMAAVVLRHRVRERAIAAAGRSDHGVRRYPAPAERPGRADDHVLQPRLRSGWRSTFYHFWLAERADLFDPLAQQNVPYLLPMRAGSANYPNAE